MTDSTNKHGKYHEMIVPVSVPQQRQDVARKAKEMVLDGLYRSRSEVFMTGVELLVNMGYISGLEDTIMDRYKKGLLTLPHSRRSVNSFDDVLDAEIKVLTWEEFAGKIGVTLRELSVLVHRSLLRRAMKKG